SIMCGSRPGTEFTRCRITSAARSSGRVKRKPPRFAFPTAVRYPAVMYASIGDCIFYPYDTTAREPVHMFNVANFTLADRSSLRLGLVLPGCSCAVHHV